MPKFYKILDVEKTFYAIFSLLSPISFLALCWGRMDWAVMRLVATQMHFKVVVALVLWILIVYPWGIYNKYNGQYSFSFQYIVVSWMSFQPLVTCLFLDGLKDQSRPFRVAIPVIFVVYVGLQVFIYGFLSGSDNGMGRDTLLFNTTLFGNSLALKPDYQLASSMQTILFLMVQFLYRAAVTNKDGTCISWPISSHISVKKEDAASITTTLLGSVRARPATQSFSHSSSHQNNLGHSLISDDDVA